MILCELASNNFEIVLGTPEVPLENKVVFVAQKPDCSSFLVFSGVVYPGLLEVKNIPEGYDFTYCQAWGLVTTTALVARVIECEVSKKIAIINDYYLTLLAAGFIYNKATFQIDIASQQQINLRVSYALAHKQDAVMFPWGSTYSAGWWDAANVYHAMTADEFLDFAKAVSDYCSACAKCARDHKNAVTAENCMTYDHSSGWPVNNG